MLASTAMKESYMKDIDIADELRRLASLLNEAADGVDRDRNLREVADEMRGLAKVLDPD